MELNIKVELSLVVIHGIVPAQADILRPLCPCLLLKSGFYCHIDGIVSEPPPVFCLEPEKLSVLADIAPLIGFSEKRKTVSVQLRIINAVLLFSKICAVALLPGEDSLLNQILQADEIGIACKGRKRLVG